MHLRVFEKPSFFAFRENGVPVISFTKQKDIALEVKVTNQNGDDAHEASVVASFPRAFTYSAFRGPPNVCFITHTHHCTHRQIHTLLGCHTFADAIEILLIPGCILHGQ